MNSTKSAIASFDSPRHSFYFPNQIGEVELINPRQKAILTTYIFQNLEENEREQRLSELDDLSSSDAEMAIFQFRSGRWQ